MHRLRKLSVAALLVAVTIVSTPGNTRERFATLDGAKVFYTDSGSGDDVVVLVHGWTCDSTFWRLQQPALSRASRVIALDLPGHGRSDKPEVDYTQEHFARAVDAVMRDAKVSRATIVGHSMGVTVARQFYRRYPEKTAALVFVDGALRLPAPKERMAKFYEPLRGPDYAKLAAGAFDGMLGTRMPAELKEEYKRAMLSTPQRVVVGTADHMLDDAVWATDPIRVPVLAIFAKSPSWKEDNEAFVRGLAPDVDYQMWDGVGHFLMIEEAERFNDAVAAFLRRLGHQNRSR